jgi:SAM-dependent methyltransferase
MNRTDIIQLLIKHSNAKSYLEIGVDNGVNFALINCAYKVSVDPNKSTTAIHHLTSDDFFKINKDTFDIIFVDGLHHADQVYRDIENSLKVLNPGGYIICHDMNPIKEEHQTIPFVSGTWNGDCWKAFVQLRTERTDLEMFVIDTDQGCGVITRGKQELLNLNNVSLNYKNFDVKRREWLNIISVDQFVNRFASTKNIEIDEILTNFVNKPNDPENNFLLALYYDNLGQTASAVSYYLRTAERSLDDLLKYECLLRAAECFEKQGTRKFTVKGLLLQAIALMPKRPEAYFKLSIFYEAEAANDGRWAESYTISSIGLSVVDYENLQPLRTNNTFPGKYGLLFQKAHAAWWSGLCDESKNIFLDLYTNYDMNNNYKAIVYNNLINMNAFVTKKIENYTAADASKMKIKFENIDLVDRNYSESYQDMFVLSMLNGKQNGTYVEIGAGDAFYGNNSFLLENKFGWKGVSFDIEEEFVNKFINGRKNPCLLKDARLINYSALLPSLGLGNQIDYLQIDCDPPEVSYNVLLNIPFETIKFAVITFEHDHYTNKDDSYRQKARDYLSRHGYVLVAGNIAPDDVRPYEDWFVHPDLVDKEILNLMKSDNDNTKNAKKYMMSV